MRPMRTLNRVALVYAAVGVVLTFSGLRSAAGVAAPASALQASGSPPWAIRGARIVPVGSPVLDNGSIVLRNGLIEDVGTSATIPADAVVIDGSGLTIYPGLIDMANSTVIERPDGSEAQPAGARGGRGRGQAGDPPSFADIERARRTELLAPMFEAARYLRVGGPEMLRLASAGITAVLAIPDFGLIRGKSALLNVVPPPEHPTIGAVAEYRRGRIVLRSPVAEHISFSDGEASGRGYPGGLLGTIGFVRQSLYDAQWQRDARAWAERHPDQPRPLFEPALDALVPVLEGRVPAAFEATDAAEIQRALAMAAEFRLDPIIVGGAEAAGVTADLKAAGARVIYSLNFPREPGREGRGGRGARGRGAPPAEETARARAARLNAPKGPAALLAAGVPFAFGSHGLEDPAEFIRHAARTVTEGGLSRDDALRALTAQAATVAGVEARLGTLEKGKVANLVVADGDLFAEGTRVRHVFIDGYRVDIESTPAPDDNGRRGGNPPGR